MTGPEEASAVRDVVMALLRGDANGTDMSDAEWEALLSFAIREGLCGIIARQLKNIPTGVPSWVGERLSAEAARVAAANLHTLHITERLIADFNRAEIPVMLLKGAALLHTIYADPGLRPMSDVDLLIRPRDCALSTDVLNAFGARVGRPLVNEAFFPRFHYEQEWIVPGVRAVRIDLHARPLRPLRVSRTMPDEAIWENAQRISLGAGTGFLPGCELMLIHLASHAAFHGGERLLWLFDIDQWVRAHETKIDWEQIVEGCRAWRLSCAVAASLSRCASAFGSPIPQTVLCQLRHHGRGRRDRWTLWQAPRDAGSPFGHIVCNLICTPGIRFRMAYLKALVSPSSAHLAEGCRARHAGWKFIAQVRRCVRIALRMFSMLSFRRAGNDSPPAHDWQGAFPTTPRSRRSPWREGAY